MILNRDRAAGWATALLWLICSAMLLYIGRYYVSTLNFRDPDDALRLVEVRNWMAGQSWFDVTQYRSHPPVGAPMHWSRLVDIPIAACIAFFSLFASPLTAERLATLVVPLLMLGGLFAILHRLTVRMTDNPVAAIVAAFMLAGSVGVLVQFSPPRLDHHGWQITLGLLAVWLIVARNGDAMRNAALGGLVMAVNLTIAIEGLPLAVALGAVLAIRYLRRGQAVGGLLAYLFLLGGAGALLLPVMLGQHALVPWCDSLSPAYVGPVLLVALVLGAASRVMPQRNFGFRLLCLAVAGGAGALLLATATPQCLRGPFATLDPLVYRLWYMGIKEGMPVWTQSTDLQMLVPLPSILGLIGTLLAIRFDAAERRERWIELLIVQALAFAVSVMVMRAMGLAHVLAMPGNAWLCLAALAAAMRLRTPLGRVLLGFSCFALTPLGAEVIGIGILAQKDDKADKAHAGQAEGTWDTCVTRRGFEQLNRLPTTELLAPLDIGSHMLAFTHHSVVATGHHRNIEGMKTVIAFFIADPDRAHAIIAKTPARYVGFCPTENEAKRYADGFPHGLMAALMKDKPPKWLQRVPMERKDDIRFYKVVG